MKELWCLDTADEGCKGGCEGAVVSRAVGGGCVSGADEGCKGGCEGAVVYRA